MRFTSKILSVLMLFCASIGMAAAASGPVLLQGTVSSGGLVKSKQLIAGASVTIY
jgi:hypothetical protein